MKSVYVILSATLFATQAWGRDPPWLYGGLPTFITCYSYGKQTDPMDAGLVAGWLSGFWSGLNNMQAVYKLGQVILPTGEPLFQEFDKICAAHPDEMLTVAAFEAWANLLPPSAKRMP